MSYTALYRKWRPKDFEDVKGQEHIVRTLKNQIKANRIGHAYLFCGTRGTGKTSVAKILSKAVNCLTPVDGSPCNTCASCMANKTNLNIVEIDAASNNGVDNIRDIRDEVQYSPTEGKYKVYIIDEVHMLSIGAFNALLKTLEEPPGYVIFILATTEVHKIPATIMSRCQRFDFRRITIEEIQKQLQELMDKEGIIVEEKALRYIAKAADGSMRDGLSILEQCISFYLGQELTLSKVLEILGAADMESFSALLEGIINHSVEDCIQTLDRIIWQGKEINQFIQDFIWYLRNLLLVKSSDNVEQSLDMSIEHIGELKRQGSKIDMDQLMRYIRVLSEVENQVKYAANKRVMLEVGLIKLCKPEMEMSQDALLERMNILEQKLAAGYVSDSRVATVKPDEIIEEKPVIQYPNAVTEDIKRVVKCWGDITRKTEGGMKSFIKKAILDTKGEGILILGFKDELSKAYFDKEENRIKLEEIISDHIQKKIQVKTHFIDPDVKENQVIDLQKLINIDITYEE